MAKINFFKGNKAIFFTFISITIMAIIILIYTPQADITLQKDNKALKTRINNIDNYAGSLENAYMVDILKATAQKSFLSLILYIKATKTPIINLDAAFSEIMLNGTINKVPIDSITGNSIMFNNTITDWSSRIIKIGNDTFNIDTSITLWNITVNQSGPRDVDLGLLMSYDIKSNVAEWQRDNVTVRTSLSIEGFDDPLYLINTQGRYSNKIKISSMEFNQWNLTFTREHIRNGTYVHWQESAAPNFLMRFSNITTNSSCCGIESIVNPNLVIPPDQAESYVDYHFFNQSFLSHCDQVYNITKPSTGNIGLWDEFRFVKLDLDHITKYNITSEYITKEC